MNNAIYNFHEPVNEPVKSYMKGSEERVELEKELEQHLNNVVEIPLIINGKEVRTGNTAEIVMPCDHGHVIAVYHKARESDVHAAVEAALAAKMKWMEMHWVERASILLKAAELIARKYRYAINAATMLGQGKNIYQAEIDSACEVIDFLRFNVHFTSLIYGDQPLSSDITLNRLEYRPLEGFVFTITPFNFTAIAANLNTSVVLMGNTTVWKPATTSLLSNYYLMEVFQEAGLPNGVINFLPGSGALISNIVLKHKELAGIHFTGSNETFNSLWKGVSENLNIYKNYPKLVGETGGKDFIFAHSSADSLELATAIVRGAFEYQGQKCSAASRAYIPKSLWDETRSNILNMLSGMNMGDVRDLNNFVNAVIDEAAYDRIMSYIKFSERCESDEIIAGGRGDKSKGYFIEPTVIVTRDPQSLTMQEEIFGPVITIFVYEDEKYEETLKLCDETSPYALTGSVFSKDRYAYLKACQILRYAAGNFYINDKPTGAMVGQQPFGGSRASGTNDKAGSQLNLIRWVSPRTIKETLIPATDFRYSYMNE